MFVPRVHSFMTRALEVGKQLVSGEKPASEERGVTNYGAWSARRIWPHSRKMHHQACEHAKSAVCVVGAGVCAEGGR